MKTLNSLLILFVLFFFNSGFSQGQENIIVQNKLVNAPESSQTDVQNPIQIKNLRSEFVHIAPNKEKRSMTFLKSIQESEYPSESRNSRKKQKISARSISDNETQTKNSIQINDRTVPTKNQQKVEVRLRARLIHQ